MPRPARFQYPGAWHHVMNRGASRQPIFLSRKDRRLFLKLLGEAVERCQIEVHAYCLMGNHYHLLVRTPEPNLHHAIHHLAANYVRGFNARHGRDGPLFRARYKSILVETDDYLLAVSRYIHRNPVGLGVTDLAGFEWSSFRSYVGDQRPPRLLSTATILDWAGGSAAYEAYVGGPFDSEVDGLYRKKRLPAVIGPSESTERADEAA